MSTGPELVPANGAVVASLYCGEECAPAPALAAVKLYAAGSAEPVSGSFVLSDLDEQGGWAVFRPDSALEVGRKYFFRLADSEPPNPIDMVQVIEARTPLASALTLTEKSSVSETEAGPRLCCSLGPKDSCGDYPCHSTQLLRKVAAWVTWGDPLDREWQWLFRVLYSGGAAEPPWSWSHGATYLAVEQGATEACYTLELKSLIDDSVHRFDERCLALPDDAELGLQANRPAALSEFLEQCYVPPDGYEPEWCVARTAYCSTNPGPECEGSAGAGGGSDVSERCPGMGSAGSGGGLATGGSAGDSANSGSGGAAEVGSGGSSGGVRASSGGTGGSPGSEGGSTGTTASPAAKASGGCSIPRRSRPSALGFLALGAVFALRLLRTRSRQSAWLP